MLCNMTFQRVAAWHVSSAAKHDERHNSFSGHPSRKSHEALALTADPNDTIVSSSDDRLHRLLLRWVCTHRAFGFVPSVVSAAVKCCNEATHHTGWTTCQIPRGNTSCRLVMMRSPIPWQVLDVNIV